MQDNFTKMVYNPAEMNEFLSATAYQPTAELTVMSHDQFYDHPLHTSYTIFQPLLLENLLGIGIFPDSSRSLGEHSLL